MDFTVLKNEITTDPLARGYAAMSDSEVAADLNTVYRQTNKASMTGSEIFNTIVKSEFNALTDANKQLVWDILHLGTVNPFGLEATLMTDIFGAGSNTITAMAAARKNNASRATELGLGVVREGEVAMARAAA